MTRPSKWKLLFQTYFTLLVTVAIGVLLSAPLLYSRVRTAHETTYLVESFPADDKALQEWALARSNVVSFQTERGDKELRVRSQARALDQQPPLTAVVQQLREFGYGFRGMSGGSNRMETRLSELLTDAQVLSLMLAAMQVAFGGVGLLCIRRAARSGTPLPRLFPGSNVRAVATGLAGGLVLLGLGHLYAFALLKIFGSSPPGPWDSTHEMPMQAKLAFLIFGGLGAPLSEEIFFRGYLFGKFKAAGYVWFGLAVSSVLFAVVHFSDPYNTPAICLYGALLAWMFHRTGSLLAPIIAHAVNNGVAITCMVLS